MNYLMKNIEDHTFNLETREYMRIKGHPFNKELELLIAEKYQCQNPACIFPSGMAAIVTTLLTIAYRNANVPSRMIFSTELFTDTINYVIPLIESQTPHSCELIDVWDKEQVKDCFNNTSPPIISLFVESASNPNGLVPQWDLFPEYITLIVDNSWLSPLLFNPFTKGADIIIESITKYWSTGKRFGGHVLCKSKKKTTQITNMAKTLGMHVPPNHAKTIFKLAQNLEERMLQITDIMEKEIIPFLSNNSNIEWIHIWKQENNTNIYLYPGVVYFGIKSSSTMPKGYIKVKNKWFEWCKNLSIYAATSYGKSYDLVDQWGKSTNDNPLIIPVRLSIGYEDNPNRLKDLDLLIDRIKK